jgi:hypothetical protein
MNWIFLLCLAYPWYLANSFTLLTRTATLNSRHKPIPTSNSFQGSKFKNGNNNKGELWPLKYGELRGVDSQLVFDAWEWCSNLGAPAALVAGAVLATMVESREGLAPKRRDSPLVRRTKKATRFLLLTSFGFEIVSIFVTTVTGTMLLVHADLPGKLATYKFNSPLGFMQANFEFEYLTSRFCFLQGLFHWLASVALDHLILKEGDTLSAQRMNRFTSSSLLTVIVFMLSFLNRHIIIYHNYARMWLRLTELMIETFFWPLKPLTIIMIPMIGMSLYHAYMAFKTPTEEEEDAFDSQHRVNE